MSKKTVKPKSLSKSSSVKKVTASSQAKKKESPKIPKGRLLTAEGWEKRIFS